MSKPASLYAQIAATRANEGVRGPHFELEHAGRSVLVFALQDDQGVERLYAGDRALVAEVYADGTVEYADGWERLAA